MISATSSTSSAAMTPAVQPARAADGDFKTAGPGHTVKDADGDYKPAPKTPAKPAAATLAAMASLVKGG